MRNKFILINKDNEDLYLNKTKEIKEKRNYEEMKEFLNEWEIYKNKFKEEIEKKSELKNLLNFYEKSFKETKDLNKNESLYIQNLVTTKSNLTPAKLKNRKNSTFLGSKNNFNRNFCISTENNFSVNSEIVYYYYNKFEEELENANKCLKERIRKENKIFENFNRFNYNNIKNFKYSNVDNKDKNTSSKYNYFP